MQSVFDDVGCSLEAVELLHGSLDATGGVAVGVFFEDAADGGAEAV